MPHPNRVTPTGEFLATPARGLMMGNRGVLHDDGGQIGPSRWKHRNWVCCALSFKGRHRKVLQPRTWTELFFLDEAVAFAAGHRPCAECRWADYTRYRTAWTIATGLSPSAAQMDNALHAARAIPGARQLQTQVIAAETIPDGCFVNLGGTACLIWQGAAFAYSPQGYGARQSLPRGPVTVLTPAPTRAVFSAGYRPQLHPSVFERLA